MICKKCRKEAPDGAVYCPYCASKLTIIRRGRTRPNGAGTAYKRGRSWEACVVVGWGINEAGVKRPITKTKSGFSTKREALEYCVVLKNQPITASGKKGNVLKTTFKGLFDSFIERHEMRGRDAGTIGCYKAAIAYFKPLHNVDIKQITAADLQDCIDACPRKKRTKENMKAIAGLLFKYAMEKDIVVKNYAVFIFTGNDKKGTHPPFTESEIETIRKGIGKVKYADYVYFMIYTGYRPEELLSRRKEDYDEGNNCIYGGIKTEAGEGKIVTISPKIRTILETQLAQSSEYLFPRKDTDKRMSPDYFRKYCFNPCMEELGIKNRVPYSARHAFANLMKNIVASDTDKAALMGHTDASMTKYYQSADIDSLKKITDSL